MNGIADGLIGATQVVRNRGGRLDLGTGEEDLTAADRKGGRRPEPGLQCGPLVRRERAYKYRCLHVQEYTTCPKVSFGTALVHDYGLAQHLNLKCFLKISADPPTF